MSALRLLLRLAALFGPLALLGWNVSSLPPFDYRQDWGFVVLFLMGWAVLGFLFAAMPRAVGTLVRWPDLLVPLGVTTALSGAVGWLASRADLASQAAPLWDGSVLGLSLAVSIPLLLLILLAVVYAGWTTSLILQAVASGRVDLLAPLADLGRWFPRTLAALTVGIVGLMLLSAVGLATAAVSLPLSMILMTVLSLVWNLNTAALLPAALRSRSSIAQSLSEGFRASRRGMGRWWGLVVVQMILMGWLTFLYSGSGTSGNVSGFWTGGYEENCRWYEQATKFAHTEMLAPVVTLLGMLFGVVAIAVKLTVTQRMQRRAEDVEASRMEPAPMARATPLVLGGLAIVYAIVACGGLLYYKQLSDAMFAWEFRRAAEQGETPEALSARLVERDDCQELAIQLSEDADPLVRRGVLGALTAGVEPAQKRERVFGGFGESWRMFHDRAVPPLTRLLNDPDAAVRLAAVHAVADRGPVATFREPLLGLLRSGELSERVAVAESLAHWEPSAFLQTFADRAQPKEVRLALLRGTERYGWARVAMCPSPPFQATMANSLDERDAELRRVAIDALRYAMDASSVWLSILQGPDADDRRIAFRAWVEALVREPVYAGSATLLWGTEHLLHQNGGGLGEKPHFGKREGELDGERIALVLHVLCTAAQEAAARMERSAPAKSNQEAFENLKQEKLWLQLILRALAAVRHFAVDPRSGKTDFVLRMPDDPLAPTVPRKLRDFLLADAKETLGWCRRHGGGYVSPLLRVEGIWFAQVDPGPQAGQSRSLGQVLEAMHLHTDAALVQYIKEQAKK